MSNQVFGIQLHKAFQPSRSRLWFFGDMSKKSESKRLKELAPVALTSIEQVAARVSEHDIVIFDDANGIYRDKTVKFKDDARVWKGAKAIPLSTIENGGIDIKRAALPAGGAE